MRAIRRSAIARCALIPAVLLLCLTGCYIWSQPGGPIDEVMLPAHAPFKVRVTWSDFTRVIIELPRLDEDTVRGWAPDLGQTVSIGLMDIRNVEIRKTDWWTTGASISWAWAPPSRSSCARPTSIATADRETSSFGRRLALRMPMTDTSSMIFDVLVEAAEDGRYEASCSDPRVSMRGASAASALELLGAEIRYRLEICPCSSVDDDYVQLRVRGA